MSANENMTASATARDGSQPLGLCMVCMSEFAADVAECPKCHVPLSVVRKCPGCAKIISALHNKCIYCSYQFVETTKAAPQLAFPAPDRRRQQMRRLLAAGVSIAVFTTVFTVGLILSRRLEKKQQVLVLSRMATSYAVRPTVIYRDISLSGASIARVRATEVVTILDFARTGATERWWHIEAKGIRGFVRPGDFAPPKVLDAEAGFPLLRTSLMDIEDPARMLMAFDAVEFYRGSFPASPHRNELTWLAAERGLEIARSTGNSELLKRARGAYVMTAEGGEFAESARRALDDYPSAEQIARRKPSQARSPGMEIVGADAGRSSNGAPPQTFTLLDQTEIRVELPPLTNVTAGAVLQGKLTRDIRVRERVAVASGAACTVKVLEAAAGTNSPYAVVQITSMQLGSRQVGVNAFPVRISLAKADNGSSLPITLSFKLRTPLLIPD